MIGCSDREREREREREKSVWSAVERVWSAVECGGMQWNASAIGLEFVLLQYHCVKFWRKKECKSSVMLWLANGEVDSHSEHRTYRLLPGFKSVSWCGWPDASVS